MPTTIIKLLEQPASKTTYSLTEKVVGTLLQTVFWWVPNGSPDYDKRLADVVYWLIEVDEDGWPEREIAFNAQGKPILHAPTDRNMGLWTDSNRALAVGEHEIADAQAFNLLWRKLQNAFGTDKIAS